MWNTLYDTNFYTMKMETLYRKVSVKDRLPKRSNEYEKFITSDEVVVLDDKGNLGLAFVQEYTTDWNILAGASHKKGDIEWKGLGFIPFYITYWLEEVPLLVEKSKTFKVQYVQDGVLRKYPAASRSFLTLLLTW